MQWFDGFMKHFVVFFLLQSIYKNIKLVKLVKAVMTDKASIEYSTQKKALTKKIDSLNIVGFPYSFFLFFNK